MAYIETNSAPVLASLQNAVTTLRTGFVNTFVLSSKRAQIKQLSQAIHRMNNAQLAKIGITRSEIEDYANMTIRVYG